MKRRQLLPQPWWLHDDLLFWAPLCDPANPLAVYRGTGALSMTRATAALRFDGSKFVSVGNGILRIEPNGALIEGARTFAEMLYTDNSQDLLAQWTKTGITALFEADATAFGGSRWALTADGSDRIFVRSITIAAAARSLAWYVRRTDGGVVDATFCQIYREGAARASTYTLLGGGVYRVSEANLVGSAGAADTGLQIKAGKTLQVVAPAGLEAGAFCSSPMAIADAAMTRNADVLTFPSAGNIDGAVGTIALVGDAISQSSAIAYIGTNGGYISPLYIQEGGSLWFWDGANNQGSGFTNTDGVSYRMANAYSGAAAKIARNGSISSSLMFDGDWNVAANVDLGKNAGYGTYIFGHIKDLRIWNRAFTDDELKNLTR